MTNIEDLIIEVVKSNVINVINQIDDPFAK